MFKIESIESFRAEYFALPENQKKAEKACVSYDRLMSKSIQKLLDSGMDKETIAAAVSNDPTKILEKTRFEEIPGVELNGKMGRIMVDLIYQKADFIPE